MVELVNNIKNKPLKFPREVNSISDVTEDILRRMLTVDSNKRIEWENLYHHPINSFLEDQMKRDLETTMKESEDVTLNASKFYLKANMVVDHPKEIEKNENINNYAYDVVNKKKQGGFNGEMIKRDPTRKKELETTKETLRSTDQKTEVDKSEKDIIGDEETLREKQIKGFKKNSKYLLHRRNIYVFLASVAEEAMDLGKEIKFSDVVGYLLIKKLLQLLGRLKELMGRKELKELKELQFWELFQGEKDFKDIQAYVWKEYDVFRVFYESVHTRIKDKVMLFD
jgi:serine/threonine-protein kinase ULK/ATG1